MVARRGGGASQMGGTAGHRRHGRTRRLAFGGGVAEVDRSGVASRERTPRRRRVVLARIPPALVVLEARRGGSRVLGSIAVRTRMSPRGWAMRLLRFVRQFDRIAGTVGVGGASRQQRGVRETASLSFLLRNAHLHGTPLPPHGHPPLQSHHPLPLPQPPLLRRHRPPRPPPIPGASPPPPPRNPHPLRRRHPLSHPPQTRRSRPRRGLRRLSKGRRGISTGTPLHRPRAVSVPKVSSFHGRGGAGTRRSPEDLDENGGTVHDRVGPTVRCGRCRRRRRRRRRIPRPAIRLFPADDAHRRVSRPSPPMAPSRRRRPRRRRHRNHAVFESPRRRGVGSSTGRIVGSHRSGGIALDVSRRGIDSSRLRALRFVHPSRTRGRRRRSEGRVSGAGHGDDSLHRTRACRRSSSDRVRFRILLFRHRRRHFSDDALLLRGRRSHRYISQYPPFRHLRLHLLSGPLLPVDLRRSHAIQRRHGR
mmetsp:Transcript_1475/g.3428  ORF Transcript_1475/g.3428 Transcript_1475/m.3428 type:complete len:476 (-) Transcript_1475:286-1713(-)